MHFNFFALALTGLAAGAAAQSGFCPEASRFGGVSVSPSTISPGDTFTVTANLTCAVELGNTPTFLDYYIDGTATHTISGPILVARRTFDASGPPIDKFDAVLPDWFYFTDATYSLRMENSFAREGPSGDKVITVGGLSTGIQITGIESN
ncbi:hypothetical protein R3P38DRAFT_2961108 [Favolaschia claudopus]|uniref:Uncharacterized protein n=1 Tax=Favolaschia claudopus TaxID=2862362 RepID=A0AAW0B946_9AGAR